MIDKLICELVLYGLQNGLVDPADEIFVTNSLLELFQQNEYTEPEEKTEPRELSQILDDLLDYAVNQGILEEDTITLRDLFDTRIMGLLTPPPSVVRKNFAEKYEISPKEATDYYYHFSQATNYIRKDRIARDEKWVTNSFSINPIAISFCDGSIVQSRLQAAGKCPMPLR